MNRISVIFLIYILPMSLYAQEADFQLGIRMQKSVKFYLENGISFYAQGSDFISERIRWGAHYTTSRLGSALGSNAIKQDNLFISAHYRIGKPKKLTFSGGLNTGWFHADYEYEIFDDLQNNALILAPELILDTSVTNQLMLLGGFGYQLTSGNGESGAGTLYPFYFQFSVLWKLKG